MSNTEWDVSTDFGSEKPPFCYECKRCGHEEKFTPPGVTDYYDVNDEELIAAFREHDCPRCAIASGILTEEDGVAWLDTVIERAIKRAFDKVRLA